MYGKEAIRVVEDESGPNTTVKAGDEDGDTRDGRRDEKELYEVVKWGAPRPQR